MSEQVVYLSVVELESVQCGDEFLWRIPVLQDGIETGEIIGTLEDLER